MSVPLFDQTSPEDVLITSPTASTKVRHFGKKSSLSQDSSHCSVLQPFNQISRLLPHTCKHSTHKSRGSSLHKTLQSLLSEISLHPLQTAKPPSSPTSLFPLSDSTLPPASSQNASHKLPSPLSTSSSPTFITSPPPPPKPSPVPLPKRSPSPPEATPSHQPGPLLPPSLQHATDPLFEHQPFTVTWNIPDLVCNKYNISLDTSPFKGVATPAKVPGQFLSLFYTDRLGLYPHVDLTSRKKFHGGIPQRSNLRASMNKARADINYYIPSKGLAVIDWEEWRPLWDRNWGTKRIYQSLSVAHVLQTNRSLTVQEATEKAKQQFQEAAKSFMSGMLAMGRAMRPNYLWGFYLFPNCYNYGWHEPDYTGQCSKEVRRQNDELLWLWESSTALYPSVYLQESLADDPKAALMVRNRVQEALRVSALPGRSATAPVFVYMRPVFVDQNRRFLSQVDLVSTIGESAAVGASGAVLWGASTSCKALSSYLTSTLNPYITNVTAAAQLCSNFLCRGNGRCVRKSYKSNHYLHLNAENFRVVRIQSRYLVVGRPTFANLKALSRRFTCRCYKGLSCSPRTHRELTFQLLNVKYLVCHSFISCFLFTHSSHNVLLETANELLNGSL
uniref:Hyaluronidase n=1 Tax=Amphiprion percula TaxID=161767 RepID=A0A3P8TNT3_AMPPE